jgi:type III secretory pathway component EscV
LLDSGLRKMRVKKTKNASYNMDTLSSNIQRKQTILISSIIILPFAFFPGFFKLDFLFLLFHDSSQVRGLWTETRK